MVERGMSRGHSCLISKSRVEKAGNIPRGPEGIIANLRCEVELEDGSPRRLNLVGDVRVEQLGSRESIWVRSSESVRVDDYYSAMPWGYERRHTNNVIKVGSSRNSISSMFMQRTKVSP